MRSSGQLSNFLFMVKSLIKLALAFFDFFTLRNKTKQQLFL